ncbi:hypothetical protein B0T26DRAFT_415536 [Lasiosphaeria miniovina]|uniref:Uncharacterized protein n=1 Tax=Lasiosphaeria miniovina TaxID=1954250 RepID=A0AA40A5E6_9PEZI|nr:uncharacterized protein B0T26DRAFT_415536 [Lasiosphaeria miniovina]KAK0709658.1 hypothetical protein B0T26DRAFT_415536 [Lasiosphaeria miniovina]
MLLLFDARALKQGHRQMALPHLTIPPKSSCGAAELPFRLTADDEARIKSRALIPAGARLLPLSVVAVSHLEFGAPFALTSLWKILQTFENANHQTWTLARSVDCRARDESYRLDVCWTEHWRLSIPSSSHFPHAHFLRMQAHLQSPLPGRSRPQPKEAVTRPRDSKLRTTCKCFDPSNVSRYAHKYSYYYLLLLSSLSELNERPPPD